MGEKANPDGVRTAAGPFQDSQVPDDFSEALPETNAPEVNCQGSGIEESCKERHDEGMPGRAHLPSLEAVSLSSGPASPTHSLCALGHVPSPPCKVRIIILLG